jgi:hypothetical protein
MQRFKFFPLLGALAMAAFLIGGTGSAKADVEIPLGNLGIPGDCMSGGSAGYVCGQTETFTDAATGTSLSATAYSGEFTGTGYLTLKTWNNMTMTGTAGSFGESGLGENPMPPGNSCDNGVTGTNGSPNDCEDAQGHSVLVTSSTVLTDVVIGSVQANAEQFELFGFAQGSTTPVAIAGTDMSSDITSANCNYDGSAICTFDLTGDNFYGVGLYELSGINAMASDALITAVSVVPAPPIGRGLPAVLAVGGLLFGAWAWDRSQKRRLPGAVIGHAAA